MTHKTNVVISLDNVPEGQNAEQLLINLLRAKGFVVSIPMTATNSTSHTERGLEAYISL